MPKFVSLDATEVTVEAAGLDGIATVECYSAKTQADIPDAVEEADVVAVWHTIWLDEALLKRFKKAKCIVRMGVGYDNVDIKAAGRLGRNTRDYILEYKCILNNVCVGIPVCNIPDYGTEEVADHAMSLILSIYRKTHVLASRVDAGESIQGPDGIAAAAGGVIRIRGQVLGIVGLGRIGMATAVRAKVFGFDVVFFDPFVNDGYDKSLGIRRADTLEELLKQSQCVSLHCNANKENEKMINTETLGQVQYSYVYRASTHGCLPQALLTISLLRSNTRYLTLDPQRSVFGQHCKGGTRRRRGPCCSSQVRRSRLGCA
jgi:C-terminal binding protein